MPNETGLLLAFPDLPWLSLNNPTIAYLMGVASGVTGNWIWHQLELRSRKSHMKVERNEKVVTFQGCWTKPEDQVGDIATLKAIKVIKPKKPTNVIQPSGNEQSTEDSAIQYDYVA